MIKLKNFKLGDKLNANLSQTLTGKLPGNLGVAESYKQKLKDLKTWAQVKSPKVFQPALSYTLGWLSPDLLGSGFRMVEVSDFHIQALVPAQLGNKDALNEIHQGLVLNSSLELARSFIGRHLPETYFQISSSEIKINKKQKWSDDLTLSLSCEESILDQFFGELQEDKKTNIHLQITIAAKDSKKPDTVDLNLTCEATSLLA